MDGDNKIFEVIYIEAMNLPWLLLRSEYKLDEVHGLNITTWQEIVCPSLDQNACGTST